jgi:hypothetical protein
MTRPNVMLGLIGVALLTSSCALFRKPEPIIRTVYQTVEVPVAVPCLKPEQVPAIPKRLVDSTPMPGTLTEMVGWLRAKLKEWQDDYGPTSQDLLTVCSRLKEAPARP